jgi:hypothetical protein
MSLFSQRKGLKPLEKTIQRDAVDEETRNRLWTVLQYCIWDQWRHDFEYHHKAKAVETLLNTLWFRYFKRAGDTRPAMYGGRHGLGDQCYTVLRNYFFACKWNEVFDFIEFLIENLPDEMADPCGKAVNVVLTEENSSCRLVNEQFVEITNDSEIKEVDAAAQTGLDGVSTHITAAVKLLSDRKSPDYRNSIKESISAVEALFKVLTKSKSATLSDGLKEMKSRIEIHPALLSGFEKIYAYTSDQGGIRHAIFDSPKSSFSDAKFMLVSCSAFINYVLGKYSERGENIS